MEDATHHIEQLPLTILMVDGDEARARHLASELPPRSHIAVASNYEHAHRELQSLQPDVLVVLSEQPGSDTARFIETVRAARWSQRMRIMVLAHSSAPQSKISMLNAGADDYIVGLRSAADFRRHALLLSRFGRLQSPVIEE